MPYAYKTEDLKKLVTDYNHPLPGGAPGRVFLWDETLRDGEQTPGVYLTLQEKIRLAKLMDEVGVELIAVGFPAVSPSEKGIVKTLASEKFGHSKILAIARPRPDDVDACIDCGVSEIVIFMPISKLILTLLGKTQEEALEMLVESVQCARDHGMVVNWVAEDASRTDLDFLGKLTNRMLDAGAQRVVFSDTVGVLLPHGMRRMVRELKARVPRLERDQVPMGIHVHNDLGMAVANTVAAVLEGVTFPHVCVNGYGERAGNAALEEVTIALEMNGIDTGIDTTRLFELSQTAEKLFGLPLSAHKAVVGDFAFSHESGLHINAILAHPMTYEPINPKSVGRKRKFFLGKGSGSGAIQQKLLPLGIDLPQEVIRKIVNKVKTTRESTSKDDWYRTFHQLKALREQILAGITDADFFQIVQEIARSYLDEQWGSRLDAAIEKIKQHDKAGKSSPE
ncbi:MAG: LeuA family protein [Promethearchaeota archaeon]